MNYHEVWQRLWEKADCRCCRLFTDWQMIMNDPDAPMSACIGAWEEYDRAYKLRDFIRMRHAQAAFANKANN